MMEPHPDEHKLAYPYFDPVFEKEELGLTLLERFVLACPLPWKGFDYADPDPARKEKLKLDAELRIEWARGMLLALRPVQVPESKEKA